MEEIVGPKHISLYFGKFRGKILFRIKVQGKEMTP